MTRSQKIFWSIVLVLIVLVVIGAVIFSTFLGDIVKKGVETFGPEMTRVSVKLDEVHVSLLTGSAGVKGLVIGNPQGYQSPQAISASTIAVGVNPFSVLSDKIVLRSLRVESPEITFEGGLGGNNLSQIMNNLNASAKTGGAPATNTTAQAKASKKFEVDDFLITGARVHVRLTDLGGKEMTLALPPVHLTDLGKNEEGITAADLSRNALNAVITATLKAVSNSSQDLGKDAQTLLKVTGRNTDQGASNIIQGVFKALNK